MSVLKFYGVNKLILYIQSVYLKVISSKVLVYNFSVYTLKKSFF